MDQNQNQVGGAGVLLIPLLLFAALTAIWWFKIPHGAPIPRSVPPPPVVLRPPQQSPFANANTKPASPVVASDCSAELQDFLARAADAVDNNEGAGGFVKINWDDAGYGISVGKLQWNQVAGGLPGLLQRWHEANPTRFREIFGGYSDLLLDETYVRYTAQFSPDNQLGTMMQRALSQPEFQAVQTQIMSERMLWAVEMAARYGHSSELFVVLVADIGNQTGDWGVESSLIAAGVENIADEGAAIAALERNSPRPNGDTRNAQLAEQFSPATAVDSTCT